MRSAFAVILLGGLVLCAGCMTGGIPIEMKPGPTAEVAAPPPPVTSDSVNEDNYRACAKRLWDELDREEQRIQLSKTTD